MDLRSRLRFMPPGSMVPADWVLGELEAEAGQPQCGGVDLTVDQVAERLGRAPGTVRTWIRAGDLRGYLLRGREYRVSEAALREFLEKEAAGKRPHLSRSRGGGDLGDWRRVRQAG